MGEAWASDIEVVSTLELATAHPCCVQLCSKGQPSLPHLAAIALHLLRLRAGQRPSGGVDTEGRVVPQHRGRPKESRLDHRAPGRGSASGIPGRSARRGHSLIKYPESNTPTSLVEACLTNRRFGTGRTQDYLRRTQSSTTSAYKKVGIWATAPWLSITDPSCSTEPRHRGTRRYDVAPCGPMHQTLSLCTRRMYESSEAQWPREIDGSTSRIPGSMTHESTGKAEHHGLWRISCRR